MKKIYSNRYSGELPDGCKLCMKGAKLVLFVTGLCDKDCYYCPLSEKRMGKDLVWANEVPVRRIQDILDEAYRMKALGAGLTGGDPAMKLKRTLGYIELLKENFGDFHIHMYTASVLSLQELKSLKKAGLDELRFHINGKLWKSIKNAISLGIRTGIEIPAIPGECEKISRIADKLKILGGDFLILNELEFSDNNARALLEKGYELKDDTSYAAKESEETALQILETKDMNIHFCSSRYKDSVQLRKRLIRTAKNIAKDYEEVSSDGLLLKGVIEIDNPNISKLIRLRKELIKKYDIPESLIAVDKEKMRIETSMEIVGGLSEVHRRKNLRYYLVEEYPTYDRLQTEAIPL